MVIATKGVKEVTIGKNESGNYEFYDTGAVVNTGDKAFMLKNEDAFTGAVDKVFFTTKDAAEKFK